MRNYNARVVQIHEKMVCMIFSTNSLPQFILYKCHFIPSVIKRSYFLIHLDIDECRIFGFCSHVCYNSHGKPIDNQTRQKIVIYNLLDLCSGGSRVSQINYSSSIQNNFITMS